MSGKLGEVGRVFGAIASVPPTQHPHALPAVPQALVLRKTRKDFGGVKAAVRVDGIADVPAQVLPDP